MPVADGDGQAEVEEHLGVIAVKAARLAGANRGWDSDRLAGGSGWKQYAASGTCRGSHCKRGADK
jgi:hypothetical protein